MKLSNHGNYNNLNNQPQLADKTDKLRNRLKYIILQYLQDNPETDNSFGLPSEMDTVYSSDMYLQESIQVLNSLTELFNLIDQHYSILNESE